MRQFRTKRGETQFARSLRPTTVGDYRWVLESRKAVDQNECGNNAAISHAELRVLQPLVPFGFVKLVSRGHDLDNLAFPH